MTEREHIQAIVVVGAMNPAIHHPGWYRAVELISEAEFTSALLSGPVCTPVMAKFVFNSLEVLCVQERWQVKGPVVSGQHLLTIADRTFTRLADTPVSAIGINNDVQLETDVMDASAKLAEMISQLPVGLLELGEPSRATLTITHLDGEYTMTTKIGPSPRGTNFLSVAHNTHQNMQSGPVKFDLAPILHTAFETAARHSARVFDALQNALR